MPRPPKQRLPLTALALVCAAALRAEPGMPFTEDPAWLVRGGVFQGKIFVAAEASAEEREAAQRLADRIRSVCGAAPVVAVENPGRTETGVYVGDTRRAKAAGVVAPKSLSKEAFAWEPRRNRRTLFLVGESPRATRLAVSRFAREQLGVESLIPGDLGADWEPRQDIAAPRDRREFVPAFAWRQLSGLETPAERAWAKDNGLGELPAMNHALWSVFDAAAFEENPAMFPLLGGRRAGPSGRGGYEPQPNLANPDSATHAARRARAFFEQNPDAPAFSLSINDNMTWDESPESRAALGYGKFFRNRPDYSDYVFGFMNRSAVALRENADCKRQIAKSPQSPAKNDALPPSTCHLPTSTENAGRRFLTAYAYYHCENTPSFRVEPEVFPILTADRSEWRDPAFAAEDAALIRSWGASGAAAFGIYDYYYGRDVAAPRIFHRAQAASLRHAASCGAKLFYAELNPDWGFDGPKAWLAARLAQDPFADAEAALDFYYKRAYGPAARPMRRFYEIAESRWADRPQPPRWIRFFREESVAELFPSPVCADMRAALDEAERAFPRPAPDAPEDPAGGMERRRLRVRAVSVSFAKTEALAAAYAAKRRLDALPDAADAGGARRIAGALAECLAAEARYFEAARRWNACALNPGGPFLPEAFRRADAKAMAALKCGAFATALPAGSPVPADAADALAEHPGPAVETVVKEGFELAGFREGTPGTWAARRGLTLPKAPWRTNLFEAEHTRFGRSDRRAASGESSLLIAGGDLARLSRIVPVRPGDLLAAKLRHAGELTAGVHVALGFRFLSAEGRLLPGGSESVALPGPDTGWRPLATFATAPAGAAAAEVQLRVMYQGPEDVVWVDDLVVRVRKAPVGE